MTMFALIFLSGLTTFALWDWWVLQKAMLSLIKTNRPWTLRIALLCDILVLFLGPGFLLRHATINSAWGRGMLQMCFVLEVIGLWFGLLAFLLTIWNLLVSKYFQFTPGKKVFVSLGMSLLATVIGVVQALHPIVRRYDISLASVPPEGEGYRILLLSDIHVTYPYPDSILNAVDKAVQENTPDLILHAGDFLDGPGFREAESLIRERVQWKAPDGFYGVFGNHDGYVGWENSLEFHEMTPIKVLGAHVGTNRVHPQEWLALTGLDDPMTYCKPFHLPKDAQVPGDQEYLTRRQAYAHVVSQIPPAEEGLCNIFLCHQPTIAPSVPAGYDMMFSGHTHGGQLFPFNFVANLANKFRASTWYSLRTALRLYICRGTGFWGPPLRFLVPAEITVITLHHQPVEAGE